MSSTRFLVLAVCLGPALGHAEAVQTRQLLTLHPVAVQVNARFAEHVGLGAAFDLRFTRSLSFVAAAQLNWLAGPSALQRDLIEGVRQEGRASSGLQLPMLAQLGVAFAPLSANLYAPGSTTPHPSELTLSLGVG